ncbi:hypothetical protein JAAARDRAFT_130654 [Jaapia argillacea MUCL 33604]|uniref:HhH-GPD domain-containing protein n=1 Tax=Jaapia argillacea MUCL 33604 TaxID=933084 RepID=A0A067PUS3_9AGAM|nr:hypothetical protein JAAARDRAFT_130654 [Jaapia argillacea MUCL 33604]
MVPAELTFSLADAKAHLIKADVRWEDIFKRMKCKPYEHLERVDPFRCDNISQGQQISWLAARSITHRFIRLFDPSLPEKPTDNAWATGETFFPTAHQVSNLDIATLRTAGLSGRKAEYVLDLATRFADGRLSTQKLMEADDDELARLLIEVRGIGRWTVDMFAIFSLRRPDILPVGDLGVQRGVLRWFLALHSPTYKFGISSKKLPKMPGDDSADKNGTDTPPAVPPAAVVPPTPARNGESQSGVATPSSSLSSTLTDIPSFPPLFTPSINQALHANTAPPPLPEGLTTSILKSRLDGKKKIKGAILTPKEMEDLTEPWRPYRSIGVYYMWSLAEESG